MKVVVAALVAITVAGVAIPGYSLDGKSRCRRNLVQVARAAERWKAHAGAADYSSFRVAGLQPFLDGLPECPDGGTYSLVTTGSVLDGQGRWEEIPPGGMAIVCSLEKHGGAVAH